MNLTRRAFSATLASAAFVPLASRFAPTIALAESEVDPLVVTTSGQLASDGTALYSVFLRSGATRLKNILMSSFAPESTEIVEVVQAPADATFRIFDTDEGSTATGIMTALDADSIAGPFTVRVRATDDHVERNLASGILFPARIAAEANVGDTVFRAIMPIGETRLIDHATDGALVVNDAGTGTALAVADTGVFLHMPPGAVTDPTPITIRRPAFDELDLPDAADTWWCSLVELEVESGQELNQPISLLLPTRQALTPGLSVSLFVAAANGEWREVPVGAYRGGVNATRPTGSAIGVSARQSGSIQDGTSNVRHALVAPDLGGLGDGNVVLLHDVRFPTGTGGGPHLVAVGVNVRDRDQGTTSVRELDLIDRVRFVERTII